MISRVHACNGRYFAISKLICDAVAFYLLPGGTSTVLRNKRAEKVSKVSAFAQMGMQAATLVQAFKTLDVGDKGYLEVKDLVSVFGMVEGVVSNHAARPRSHSFLLLRGFHTSQPFAVTSSLVLVRVRPARV